MQSISCAVVSRLFRFGAALLASAAYLPTVWAEQEKKPPHEWQYWEGRHYRLEADGNISCYSDGGRHPLCITGTAPPDPAKAKPLNCGSLMWEDGQRKKTTGYQLAGHWCNNAYANLYAKWESYKSLGQDYELATNPRGDVMCKSLDATECLLGGLPPPNPNWPGPTLKPVVCGRALLMRKSITGYDDPKLWCNTPEIVLQQRDLVVKPATDRLDENLKHMVRIPVPGWHLKERPAWILRFTMPRLSQILMRLRGDDGTFQRRTSKDDPSGLRFAYMEIRGDKVYAVNQEIHTESRDTSVDSEGRGTLAMRIGEDGTPQYFQGPGWPANPFSSELKFEFGQGDQARWRWNVDKNRPFIPWQYTKEGSAENAVEIWLARDFRANRLPTLNNFLMIRGRETSPQ